MTELKELNESKLNAAGKFSEKEAVNITQYQMQPCFIIADYKVSERVFRGIIKDIGAEGLTLCTDRQITVGQYISIELPLFQFDFTILVEGKVVRRESNGFFVSFDEKIYGLICKDGLLPVIDYTV